MAGALFHLHSRLIGTPLLIEPRKLDAILRAFEDRLDLDASRLASSADVVKRPAVKAAIDRTGIATYPIIGSLVHRGDAMDALSGVVSYVRIANDLTNLVNNPACRGIMLEIDSGGGEAAGVAELADVILRLRQEKPIWASANMRAASAAYWIASAAEKLIVSPITGSVGSIGVVVAHQDVSKALEKRGVVMTFVFAGDKKIAGNPFEPLPDNVRADIQTSVDALYEAFTNAVAVNRGIRQRKVIATQAAMFSPNDALEAGLVDGVGTLSEALDAMAAEMGATTYALGGFAR